VINKERFAQKTCRFSAAASGAQSSTKPDYRERPAGGEVAAVAPRLDIVDGLDGGDLDVQCLRGRREILLRQFRAAAWPREFRRFEQLLPVHAARLQLHSLDRTEGHLA